MAIDAKQQELIDEIMDYFDFDKVHECMDALGWEWIDEPINLKELNKNTYSIPDVGTIRKHARRLLRQVIEENVYRVATGGLQATWHDGVLSLEFIVAEWEAHTEES